MKTYISHELNTDRKNVKHTLKLLLRNNQIVICSNTGVALADITLSCVTDENGNNTGEYYVSFVPLDKRPVDKNIATCNHP